MKASGLTCRQPGFTLWPLIALTVLSLIFPLASTSQDKPAGLAVKQALEIYAQKTGTTILRPFVIPESSLAPLPVDTNAIATFIESELAKVGFELVPDGQMFVRVLPPGWGYPRMVEHLARLKTPLRKGPLTVAPGTIVLRGASIDQVLMIYADLRKRTLLRPTSLAGTPISLVTQQALTIDEVVYALNTVMLMSGVEAIDDGDKFVQLVQLDAALPFQTRAPAPEPGATLIDPSEVPVLRPLFPRPKRPPPNPQTSNSDPQPATPGPPAPTVKTLAAYYAKLTNRDPVSSGEIDQLPIQFEAQTRLTRKELLYAIETTLALNLLEIVPVDDKSIRVGRISNPRRRQ